MNQDTVVMFKVMIQQHAQADQLCKCKQVFMTSAPNQILHLFNVYTYTLWHS